MTYRKVDFCARRSGIAWFSRLLGLAFLSALVAGSAWGQTRQLVVSTERVFVNEGGNNSFTVALGARPTGNVTVTVEQPSNTDVTIDTSTASGTQTTMTFSTSDWSTAQTVTVSAGQDTDSPAANDYAIIVIKATGGGYDRTVTAPNNTSHTLPAYGRVYVTVVDDDRNAVMLSANSLVVTEGSGKSFTARLTSQPSSNVTVSLAPIFFGTDPAFITLDKTSLTFTNSDWDDFQTVTVSGTQDNIKTNPRGATIRVSATGGYGSQDISVSAIDDDTPSLTLSTDELSTTEGVSSASFTVALTVQPTAPVQVLLRLCGRAVGAAQQDCGDRDWVTFSPSTLNFTSSNYDTGQTVTVTPVEDVDAGDESAFINMAASGGEYVGVTGSMKLTVADNDTRALVTSPESELRVVQGAGNRLGIRLATQPTGNVSVGITKSGTHSADVTLDKLAVIFTPSNWNQTKYVMASVDSDASASQFSATIELSATGADYNLVSISKSIAVTLVDGNAFRLSRSSLTIDKGAEATFTIQLASKPSGNVTVTLAQPSNNNVKVDTDANVTGNQNTLTFTQTDWDRPQTVTISTARDTSYPDISETVSISATGGGYDSVTGSLAITVEDGALTLSSYFLNVNEGGETTFTVQLATQPSSNVLLILKQPGNTSVTIDTDDSKLGNQNELLFTESDTVSNWNQPQTVKVSAAHDSDDDDISETILITATGGGYDSVSSSVRITVDDDEVAFILSPSSLSMDEGDDDTFKVQLTDQPDANVTVTLAQPSNPGVRVDTNTSVADYQNTLTFTRDNWDTDQTVTVYALEDDDGDDITSEAISITASGGGYGSATGSVSVSVDDDDDDENTYRINVSETSLSLTEGGSAGTFTVALTAKPNRAASFRLVTSDTGGAITATPSTLTFNLSNYDTPQTVTVSPGHDPDAQDDSETISINPVVFDNAIEPGSYDDVTASVSVNVTDDDSPGFTLPSRLSLDEGGGAKTLKVWLATLPTEDVTVSLTSGDTGAVTVSPASLTFTPSNYNTVQTVTVTPVDDSDSVDESVQIFFTASDGGYDDATGSVTVSVNDDELRKLELPTTSVLLRKAGHPNTFRVGLRARPSGNVTVSLVSSDTSVATVSPASMTFTPSNHGRFQTATVATTKAANSFDETASINLSASGGGYDGATGSVTVSVGDLGFELSSVNLSLTEGGSAGNFTVALATAPTANVTVSLASSNSRAARVSPASLTFTPSNYGTVQTVTVTPVQDDSLGDRSLSISLTSSGGGYGSVTGSVAVAVEDDDDRGLDLSSTSLSINEGATGTFTVKLNTQPPLPPSPTTVPIIGGGSTRPGALSSDVTVSLVSSDTSNVTVSPSSLTFTRNNYNTTQTVTVTAIEDSDSYSENANINLVALGIGSYFTGTVAVSVVDVSTGFDFSSTSLMLTERGTATFTVTLNEQQPQSDVEVLLLSSDMSSIRVSPSEMKFTPSNYRQPQTVTVTAIDDGDSDDEDVNISFLASGGNYDDATGRVAVSVTDDDIPVLDISRTSLRVTEETAGTFNVKLRVAPSQNVTVSLTSADTSSVTVSPSSLTFTASNYGTAQAVTVTAVDDVDLDSENVNIDISASGGGYGDATGEVAVSVVDNDAAIFELSAAKLRVAERNTDSFTVKLRQPPSGSVTVSLASSDTSSVTASPSSLTFTALNYDTEQTVTVAAIEDRNTSGENVSIDISASGGGYDDVTGTVRVITEDNDVRDAYFTIHNPSTRQVSLKEGGTSAVVYFSLGANPDENVIISLRSSDESIVRVTPSSMAYGTDPARYIPHTGQYRRFFLTPSGQDEDLMDEKVTIYMSASGDRHSGATETIEVTVVDDDRLGLELSQHSLSVNEGGSPGTFKVALNESPIHNQNVKVSVTSSDTVAATVAPAELSFGPGNYEQEQTVTVMPVDDNDPLDESVEISLTSMVELQGPPCSDPPVQTDPSECSSTFRRFDGRPVKLPVTVIDDERFDVNLSKTHLSIREGGVPGTFRVALDSQPSADVTVSLTSSDTGAATVPSASLTFTASNYDTAQTVSVSAVDDDDDIADEDVNISFSVSGGGFAQTDLDRMFGNLSVSVSVDDDDTGSLDFSATSLQLSEGGAAGTFEVKLAASPTGRVTVAVEGNHGDAVTISPSTLNFTASNYDTNRTITVTPMDDADLRDENVDITLSASGGGYDDVSGRVAVSVDDDDAGALELSVNSLSLDEGGDDGTFTVKLAVQPTGNVTVDLASEDDDAATVSPSQLTFTRSNYDMAQTVTVTPVDDADSNDEDVDITLSVSGGGYDDVSGRVAVSVADDDRIPSYLRHSPSTAAKHLNLSETVTEQGKEVADSGTLGVRLSKRPSGTVTLTVTQVSPANKILEFDADLNTSGNQNTVSIRSYSWRVPKAIKVFTLPDSNLSEDSAVVRVTATGGGYDGQTLDYSVTIEDTDNTASIVTDPASSLDLNEGESGVIRFKLSHQPPADTNFGVEVSTTSTAIKIQGSDSRNRRYPGINPANWDSYSDIAIDTLRDLDTDDETAQVTFRVHRGGGTGVSWQSKTVTVNITDADIPNSLSLSSAALTIQEGEAKTFAVRLTSAPGAGNTIAVAVAPDSGGDLSVDKPQLIFTNDNWSDPQTVTVTAGEDVDAVNDDSSVTLTASGTSDYSGKTATVNVRVIDEDEPVLLLSATSLSINEGGSAGTFTVELSSPPTEDVMVGVLSRDIGIARVSPASLTFDSSSWNTAQTVSVTAAEDDDFDNEKVTISLTASGDDDYDGLAASVSVSVADDDSYFLDLSDDALSLNEGGTGSFTVALGARPLGDVTVTLVQPSNTKVMLDTDRDADGNQTTLNFVQASWNVAQNVYVKAALDSDSDDETATISMSATGGGYGLYGVEDSVGVSVVDNGALALTIGSYERALSEGQTYRVDIRLASQPESDVTVAVMSSDPSAVAITDPASGELTFTTSNWSTDQTLSFQAVEDGDAANERVVISMSVAGTDYSFSRSLVVTTRDNDKVELVLSKTELTTVEGVAGTFTVKLGSQPTGTVTVTPSFEAFFGGTVDATLDTDTTRVGNQSTLKFTKVNWNTARTVAVMPNADDDAKDEQFYVNLSASGANYDHQYGEVTVTVTDDDGRGILVSDTSLLLNEGGTASFSLRLSQQPSAGQRQSSTINVRVGPGGGYFGLTSTSDTAGSNQDDVILQFTDDNWDTAQTVEVSAPQDDNLYEERTTLYITAEGGDHTDIKPAKVRLHVLETNYKETQTGVKEIDRGAASDFIVVAAGTAANTFDVSLSTAPTQNVRVTLSSVLTLDKTTLNFIPGNYNTVQTVTITPFTDTRRPATENFDVTLQSATTPAVTGADQYRATRVFSVEVTRDNSNTTTTELALDRPHLVVTAGSQSNVIMVALSAQPGSDVQVIPNMSSEDFKIATATPRILTFNSSNWETPQAVTVTSSTSTTETTVDVILNGQSRIPVSQRAVDPYKMSRTVTVTLEAAPRDLRAIGFNLSKPSLQVTEGGTPGTFGIKLTRTYSSSLRAVQIDLTSDDTAIATVSPANLIFTSTNWSTAQTVTVASVEDADMDDERVEIKLDGYSLTYPAPKDDGSTPPPPEKSSNRFISYTYTVSVVDDDDSGFVLSPRTLALVEGGSAGSFTVALATQPTEDVTVSVASLAPNAATVSESSLTFTRANYNTPQSVTVTPVDDVDLENETFNIVVSAADGGYGGDTDTVAVTVEDDDSVGFTLSTKALTVAEEGTGFFTVALRNEPTGEVMVTLSQPDNDDVRLDTDPRTDSNQNTLTFGENDWNEGKRVTVSAGHDVDSSNEGPLTVNLTASGGGYGSAEDSMTISVTDNDPPELDVGVPASGLAIEEGMTGTFTIALATQPAGDVTVTLMQPNNTDIKVDTNTVADGNQRTLSFGTDDWSTPQTVTVRVRDDEDSENETGSISMSATGGGYESAGATVLVRVTDTDTPGLTLTASQLSISEGENQTFDVSLRVDPNGPVTVTLEQPSNNDVTLDTSSDAGNQNMLEFTADTWDIPQTVTVNTVADADAVDDSATINISALNSGYGDVTGTVTVTVTDPQVQGLVWSESPLSILEGENKTVTLKLLTQPTEDVTVTLGQPSNTDLTLDTNATDDGDQSMLTFTTDNWNTAQDVVFTAAVDQDQDTGSATVNVTTSGGDYDDLDDTTLSIRIIDKDVPRLLLSQSTLSLSEGGAAEDFTVELSLLPTEAVTVSISAGADADLLQISTPGLELTFTTDNWNVPQTVTINAVEDTDATDEDITVSLTAAGGNYAGVTENVAVTIDDDEAELVLSAETLSVIEGGASGEFTVALSSRPTATVTLNLTLADNDSDDSTDPSQALEVDTDADTAGPQTTLTFTQDDWGTARTVMVTAIEDGDITEEEITITLSATGGDYAGLSEDVTVSVSENDIPRIVLTETSLALCEVADGDCGISGSFTAVFSVAPDQATAVTVTSSDPGAAAVTAGATLTFSPNDWSTPQTVTITRVEDNDAVDESVTVTVAVTTTGGNYAGQSETVAVSVRDSGTAGLTLSPTSLTVTEGSTGTFDVQLAAEPTEDVTVTLAQPSNTDVTVDTDTGTASNQNTLAFDASNWNSPQTVTVSAAEDVDGNNDEADIVISASGGEYADADEVTLRVTVNENDTASLELSGNALGIDEGSTGTFNVKLRTQPVGGNVTVGITSDDAGAVSVSTASLTFTADNWNATQNITVTGVGDDDAENEEVTVTLSASGADYGNVADVDVTVTVTDDEDIEMTLSTSSLTLTEGEVGTFTVELGSQPTDDVTVSITSSDTEVAFAEPDSASLTFTADNWEDAQTVMINAADDSDAEDGQATITVSASGGGYGGVESGTVAVEVWDDDRTAGLILSTTGPLSLEEDSASDSNSVSFTVKLASPPVGDDVTVAVTNPDAGAVSASAPSLTFTTSNWNITQPLTIGAVQDDDAQNEDVTVTLSPTGGGYGSEQASTLQVTVDDDESIGLMISAYLVELEEGNSVDLTVSMASQPTADVTVTFANPEPTFLAVDADSFTSGAQGSMTFRTDNWETPQTVSIIAIEDDDLEDGKATVTYRVAGGDYQGYCQAQGRDPACAIEVTVTDNDKATAERDGATQVLAAVARATLAGSLDVISRRFDASAGARRVQFGGRNVALDQSGIDDLVGHFAQMARTREEFSQSNRYGDDLFGVNRQSAEWLGSIPLREGRPAFAQPNAGGFSNDMQMLGSFTYALTSSADSGGSSMATSSLWGSSEQREFSGTVQQVPYEGNQSAVWLGYDQRTENGWLYGVAASRSSGEADYKIRNSSARIETQLRTYMPYIEITGESGASVRVVYGFGIGEVKVQEINSNEGTAKLTMDMTSVGGRWPFLQIGIGGTLSATGSIASSRMTTGSSAATPSISELNVDSQQMRAGLELAHSGFGSGMRLAPRFGVAVRQDEGDGITGSGVEVTAAVQMTTPGSRFSLDLNGHWLTSHSAEDETEDQAGGSQTLREEDKVELDEWGMSLTLRVASSDAVGRGFSMSLGPEWGAQQSDLLDREEAFNLDQHDLQRMRQSAQRMVLATRLGYGMDAFGGLLTPFAEYNFSGGSYASSRLTSGLKFMRTDSFEARLFGEQRITQGQKPENKIGVELRQYLF